MSGNNNQPPPRFTRFTSSARSSLVQPPVPAQTPEPTPASCYLFLLSLLQPLLCGAEEPNNGLPENTLDPQCFVKFILMARNKRLTPPFLQTLLDQQFEPVPKLPPGLIRAFKPNHEYDCNIRGTYLEKLARTQLGASCSEPHDRLSPSIYYLVQHPLLPALVDLNCSINGPVSILSVPVSDAPEAPEQLWALVNALATPVPYIDGFTLFPVIQDYCGKDKYGNHCMQELPDLHHPVQGLARYQHALKKFGLWQRFLSRLIQNATLDTTFRCEQKNRYQILDIILRVVYIWIIGSDKESKPQMPFNSWVHSCFSHFDCPEKFFTFLISLFETDHHLPVPESRSALKTIFESQDEQLMKQLNLIIRLQVAHQKANKKWPQFFHDNMYLYANLVSFIARSARCVLTIADVPDIQMKIFEFLGPDYLKIPTHEEQHVKATADSLCKWQNLQRCEHVEAMRISRFPQKN
jgi:hypothetical protein